MGWEQFVGCVIPFNGRVAIIEGTRSNYDMDAFRLKYSDSESSFEVNVFDTEILDVLPDPKHGFLKRNGESVLFVYNDIEYGLASHPYERCLYITKDNEIIRVLHNAFDVYELPEYFAEGKTLESGKMVFDAEAFSKVLAAAIDSYRYEMNFDFAARLVKEKSRSDCIY